MNNDTARKLKEKFAFAHKNHASQYEFIEVSNVYGEMIKVNQFEISEIVESRLEEILTIDKKEIRSLTSRNIDYVIVTGGTSNMANFNYIAKEVFGTIAKIGNVKLIGIRNNKYSTVSGLIKGINDKLESRDKEYTMIDLDNDASGQNKLSINDSSVLNKVFGYFFDN